MDFEMNIHIYLLDVATPANLCHQVPHLAQQFYLQPQLEGILHWNISWWREIQEFSSGFVLPSSLIEKKNCLSGSRFINRFKGFLTSKKYSLNDWISPIMAVFYKNFENGNCVKEFVKGKKPSNEPTWWSKWRVNLICHRRVIAKLYLCNGRPCFYHNIEDYIIRSNAVRYSRYFNIL